MRGRRQIVFCAAVCLVLAACQTEEPAVGTLEPPPQATQTTVAPPSGETQLAADASVAVAQSAEHGRYIVDSSGRALYMLEGEGSEDSGCYDDCAKAWPPFVTPTGQAGTADPAIARDRIATMERRDGLTQVVYNNHLLYYYAKDTESGQTQGQEVRDQWGEWYLVTPEGTPLEKSE